LDGGLVRVGVERGCGERVGELDGAPVDQIAEDDEGLAAALDEVGRVAAGVAVRVEGLEAWDDQDVAVEGAEFAGFEATVTRSVSGWVWGNVVFGGLVGLAVDAISGYLQAQP
jgi:hypothetical protein